MNLFNLSNSEHLYFNIFTEANKKNNVNVDFLVRWMKSCLLMDVELKTKDKLKSAMNKYDCNHGIVVFSTKHIEKDGDVIFVLIKTFSFS